MTDEHTSETAIDLVCGMTVSKDSPHRVQYDGTNYFFCSAGCRKKFVAEPGRFMGKKDNDAGHGDGRTIYTCPMHPEIRQVGPGSCPICGMALEPEIATADTGPNPELADMTRRFWIGLALTVPVTVLDMGGHLVGPHGWVEQTLSNWIQF